MIGRILEERILQRMKDPKVLLLFGARQVGKTTLLVHMFAGKPDVLWLNGDEADVRGLFASGNSARFAALLGQNHILVIDEAQRIEDIGLKLKLICDEIPAVKVIASGSSSFMLANSVNEPLTGRKWEFLMHPIAFEELSRTQGLLHELRMLEQRMIYGSYPDIVMNPGDAQALLVQLSNSYLYKDVLEFEQLRKASKLVDILRAIALQLGSEVSLPELGGLVGLDVKTIERYLVLLEQSFIIFRLPSFARNMRNEIKHGKKIYFVDTGVRNAILAQFAPLANRMDVGPLWENYLISERRKYLTNHGIVANTFFWRTHTQQEIDYVEERDGILHAYEFKWNPRKKVKPRKSFVEAYPESTFTVVTPDNYDQFLT